jgi:myo-inositol-hexaphosphate 3-phosphohydrolase
MGMDTFRRRSHKTKHEHRADALADLLGRVLRQYHQAVATDTLEHPCSSCATDVAIYARKARALGVEVAFDEEEAAVMSETEAALHRHLTDGETENERLREALALVDTALAVTAASDEENDEITPSMIERAARALSDQTQGGHGNHWCDEWQKPDTPGVCGLCWDHAEAVLNAALTETAIVEKEL